jgi:hypothetical protein
MFRIFMVLCFSGLIISGLFADEAAIGSLRVDLPEGFRHQVDKGIDTAVGSFQPADGSFEIRYDIGPGAGSDRAAALAQKKKYSVVKDIVIQTALGKGRFVAVKMGDGTKFMAAFDGGPGLIFYGVGLTERQLGDFISIAKSLRLVPEPVVEKSK